MKCFMAVILCFSLAALSPAEEDKGTLKPLGPDGIRAWFAGRGAYDEVPPEQQNDVALLIGMSGESAERIAALQRIAELGNDKGKGCTATVLAVIWCDPDRDVCAQACTTLGAIMDEPFVESRKYVTGEGFVGEESPTQVAAGVLELKGKQHKALAVREAAEDALLRIRY